MKNKIIILQRILPHYRAGIFRKLCERFPGMKVFYGQPLKDESLKNAEGLNENFFINCRNTYLDKNGKIFISNIFSKINQIKPEVIISVFNIGNLNIYILFILRKILKFKLILWSFGYDPVSGFNPEKKITDKIRLYLSQKADAVIFYWENGRDELNKFSKRKEHYFVAPNTLDTDKQTEHKKAFDITGKDKIKTELGVNERFHFVYTGRLLEDKQIDLLLRAYAIVERRNINCRLTIIGDGPERNNLTNLSQELGLKNIHFTGEILDEEQTGKWIYISDAFIMPGRLGLSVVHTFCFGTPVISQRKEKYFHGEGIGYVKDGENGFLVEDGNVSELAEKMLLIISDNELSERLRTNAFYTSRNECSVENMIEGFEHAIEYVVRTQ
jgi:glycosyltransferase involved in cell wall biosynthesis